MKYLSFNRYNFGLLIFTIMQFGATYLAIQFSTFQNLTAYNPSLRPAIYAFSIWGVILILSLISSIFMFIVKDFTKYHKQLASFLSIVYIGYSVWLLLANYNLVLLSLIVFGVMNAALIMAIRPAFKLDKSATRIAVISGLMTYLGWASMACIVNIDSLLLVLGISNIFFSSVLLIGALGVALILFRVTHYSVVYFAVVGFAISAIMVNLFNQFNLTNNYDNLVLLLMASIVFIIFIALSIYLKISDLRHLAHHKSS